MKKKNGKTPRAISSRVDLAEVKRVLDFMAQHDLEEFEYEASGYHVHLKKPAQPNWGATSIPTAPHSSDLQRSASSNSSAIESADNTVGLKPSEELHVVKSPIVGTYYEASSPGSEPFVKVGSQVTVGQTLCIIEAMKLMNEIEADMAGEIVEVKIANGQPVEYGEPLFAIRPNK